MKTSIGAGAGGKAKDWKASTAARRMILSRGVLKAGDRDMSEEGKAVGMYREKRPAARAARR